jgi:hypothetical protein
MVERGHIETPNIKMVERGHIETPNIKMVERGHIDTPNIKSSTIFMLGVSIWPRSTILLVDFLSVPTVWYSLFFHFITKCTLVSLLNYKYLWNDIICL